MKLEVFFLGLEQQVSPFLVKGIYDSECALIYGEMGLEN